MRIITRKTLIPRSLAALTMAIAIATAPAASADPGKIVASRDLRFADLPDGRVEVTNATSGQVVAELDRGTHNFVRALMRGLVQARLREQIGPEIPFRLTAFSDGQLVLVDPATHRRIELEAFGPTNAGDFVDLLPLRRANTGENQ